MISAPPGASVILPALDGRTALTVIRILENVIDAIWDAHRDAINHIQSDLSAAPAPPPRMAPNEDDDLF
jgi:hypothetical protein